MAIHDVEPRTLDQSVWLRQWLRDRGADQVTLFVVPAPRLHPFDSLSPDLADWLRSRVASGDVVAQLGLRHARMRSGSPLAALRARLAGVREAEFTGMDEASAASALEAGRAVMRRAGLAPHGFVAPGYHYSRALRRAVATRFPWWADSSHLSTAQGRLAVPLLRPGATSLGRFRGPERLDVRPADLDHPARLAAIGRALERRSDLPTVTYDALASGAGSPGTAAAQPAPAPAQVRSPAAAAPRPRPQ